METFKILGMELSMGKLTVIAIILSPVFAVLVSIWVQSWKDKKWWMRNILATLMATRHHLMITDEIVRSLNIIDVAFYNKPKVRKHWSEYFKMLHNTGYDNPAGHKLWNQKKNQLMLEMATASGFRRKITNIDVDRVYIPMGLVPDTGKTIGTEAKPALKKKKAKKKKAVKEKTQKK